MEPEDNLDCPDLIEKFMANHEKSQMTSTKMVRLHKFTVSDIVFISYTSSKLNAFNLGMVKI